MLHKEQIVISTTDNSEYEGKQGNIKDFNRVKVELSGKERKKELSFKRAIA